MNREFKLNVRLDAKDRAALRAIAKELQRSQSNVVRMLIHNAAQTLDVKPANGREAQNAEAN